MSIRGLPYRLAFRAWRSLPASCQSIFRRRGVLRSMHTTIRDTLALGAARDDVYSRDYYNYVETEAVRSAATMAGSILDAYRPSTALDVGCGTGALLHELRERGVETHGLEYSDAGLAFCRKRGLNVDKFDITSASLPFTRTFDVAISMEVAEHIPTECSERLVDILCTSSSRIVFTAATPGQGGGVGHINEQPHGFWIELFERRGFRFETASSLAWRKAWAAGNVAGFYSANLMLFQRITNAARPR